MSIKKRSNAEWEELIREQRASGETRAEWCGKRGINADTMKDRAYRLRKADSESTVQTGQKQTKSKAPKQEQIETNGGTPGWVEIIGKGTVQKSDDTSVKSAERSKGDVRALANSETKGSVTIEIGRVRIMAEGQYPIEKLTALCGELMGVC
jgi:hypothetical protein